MNQITILCAHPHPQRPPLALGQLLAYAREHVVNPRLDLSPRFVTNVDELRAELARGPAVVLLSNYLWNLEANLELSAATKRYDPRNVTVHGGPSTPSYESACGAFLREYRHVDYVVHNEGERTCAALLDWIAADRSTGCEPAGIGFLELDRLRLTEPRPRAADLGEFPSAYLSGIFSDVDTSQWESATVETNRGCPYGCTFCDWGSATRQKVRPFNMDRVTGELRWLANRRIPEIWLADANFGILPRDVEIARTLCRLKGETGYPQRVVVNYAKNTHRYLVEIVERFVDAGLVSTGIISLQTRDEDTLAAVRRRNIKTREYDKLRTVFQDKRLPLTTQLMIGLPGSTVDSLKRDLRTYFDTEVQVQCFRTALLPNSPMADPDYIAEHRLIFDDNNLVRGSRTFSGEELAAMCGLVRAFNFAHKYGALRHVLCFLQRDYDIDSVDFLFDLVTAAGLDRRSPLLAELLDPTGDDIDLLNTHWDLRERLRRDSRWDEFLGELTGYILDHFPQVDDTVLATVTRVQARVMPDAKSTFPTVHRLDHDYVAYDREHRQAGVTRVPRPLVQFGAGTLPVDDPWTLSSQRLRPVAGRPGHCWELESPLSRRLEPAHTAPTVSFTAPALERPA